MYCAVDKGLLSKEDAFEAFDHVAKYAGEDEEVDLGEMEKAVKDGKEAMEGKGGPKDDGPKDEGTEGGAGGDGTEGGDGGKGPGGDKGGK